MMENSNSGLNLKSVISAHKEIINSKFKDLLSRNQRCESEWLMPKDKVIRDNAMNSLSVNEREAFKQLGSNMIVSGKITLIESDHWKKVYIEVRLIQVLAILYDGENLIDEDLPYYLNDQISGGIDSEYVQSRSGFLLNLYSRNIIGYIRKHDIYDNKLPHLNEELDENLQEGKVVTCLIVRNKLNESKYQNHLFRRDDFIQLSLKNSLIKNSKQYFIADYLKDMKIPFTLGACQMPSQSLNFANSNDSAFLQSSSFMNEFSLKNLIKDLGIPQYEGSLWKNGDIKYSTNEESGFSYEILRKVQNYDWSDEYMRKGNELMEINSMEKALENFKDAEKLDSLNKEIYLKKGICYYQLNQPDSAKKEFKNCLKINPNDECALRYLSMLQAKNDINLLNIKTEAPNQNENEFLNKKRHNK